MVETLNNPESLSLMVCKWRHSTTRCRLVTCSTLLVFPCHGMMGSPKASQGSRGCTPRGDPEEVALARFELGQAGFTDGLPRGILGADAARDGVLQRRVEARRRPLQRPVCVCDKGRQIQVRIRCRFQLACEYTREKPYMHCCGRKVSGLQSCCRGQEPMLAIPFPLLYDCDTIRSHGVLLSIFKCVHLPYVINCMHLFSWPPP